VSRKGFIFSWGLLGPVKGEYDRYGFYSGILIDLFQFAGFSPIRHQIFDARNFLKSGSNGLVGFFFIFGEICSTFISKNFQ
jgi:hypothetical protein